MKCYIMLVLVLICLTSSFFSSKISSRRNIARSRRSTKYDFDSPPANFIYNALVAFHSINDDDIVSCINGNSDIKGIKSDPRPKKDADEDENLLNKVKGWFSTVITAATTIISFVCEWKDALFNFITSIYKDEKRYRRRNRLFFQGKAKRMKICFVLCWAKKAYEKFMDISVAKGVKKAYNSIKDAFTAGMDKILEFVSSAISYTIKIYDTFLNNKIAKALANCSSAGKGIYNAFGKISDTLALYSTGVVGMAKILENIICLAEDIVEMIKAFFNGLSEKNSAKKWGYFGKTFGIIVKLSTSSGRRIR